MFWNWISYYARQKPRSIAVELADRSIDYATFAADIARASDAIRAALPASANLAGVRVSHGYLHWVVLIALARLRIMSVSLLDDRATAIAKADVIIADADIASDAAIIRAEAAWMGNQASAAVLGVRDPDNDFDLRLIMSSGTTGTPKKVAIPARVQVQRVLQVTLCYGISSGTRSHSQMAVDTTGGFNVPPSTWVAGGTVVLSKNPFFKDQILGAAKPNFCLISTGDLAAFVRRTEGATRLFPDTHFVVGGSAAAKGLMERARERLSSRIDVVYGATEASIVAMEWRHDDRIPAQSVGFAAPFAELQIVDDAGAVLPPRTQGHVRVRSPSAVTGYVDDAEATARHFRDGWFYPGDLGMLASDGMLVVTGRTAEMFNFGGMKVAPIKIEDVALDCPGVLEAGVCNLKDSQGDIAAIGIVTSSGYDKDALLRLLEQNFRGCRFAIAEISAVPRNNMGKISRTMLAEVILQQAARAPA